MHSTPKSVCVLILSYNGKSLLEEALTSYLGNDYENYKVCVIDNGSSDGTEEYVNKKFPSAHVIKLNKNVGYSGGLNAGLSYAFDEKNYDYALITNNDVKADKELVKELVREADKDEKTGFTIGKVYFYDHPDTFQTVGKGEHPVRWNGGHIGNMEKDNGQYDTPAQRSFCDDIYWLVKRELYKKTGGYDTTFFLQCEDYDWQARARKLGYKIMYTPFAKLWHKESMTIGKSSPVKAYYDARNPAIVIMKHKTPEFFKSFFRDHIKKNFKPVIKSIVKLKPAMAYNIFKGLASSLIWGIKNKKLSIRHFI